MIITLPASLTGISVVKRAVFLAYEASLVLGTSVMCAPGGQTEEDVWNNICSAGDYPPGMTSKVRNKKGNVYVDYVFGRMMKLGFRWDETMVEIKENVLKKDYQPWCETYPTFQHLIDAAIKSLCEEAGAEYDEISAIQEEEELSHAVASKTQHDQLLDTIMEASDGPLPQLHQPEARLNESMTSWTLERTAIEDIRDNR
jgi:hypothetical protein